MQLKGLERFAKRLTIGAIAKLMGPPQSARGERPDWRQRQYRVLFLRHDRIGDMILSTGVLRVIAESHPTIQLDVLASPLNAPVLRTEPYVHDVMVFDRKNPLQYPATFRELRHRRYDAVIDCMVTAPSMTTLLLMLASGAPTRIGVAGRGNDFAYTLPVPPRENAEHIIDNLAAVLSAFGIPASADVTPRIHLSPAELEAGDRMWNGADQRTRGSTRVLVNVSAGHAVRFWGDDRYAHVITETRRRFPKVQVLLIGAPSERDRVDRLARATQTRTHATPGLRDALALIAGADLVFTPDTSIAHAATALNRPSVVLYPRWKAKLWGPYGNDCVAIESTTETLEPIAADQAARAVARSLQRLARGVAALDDAPDQEEHTGGEQRVRDARRVIHDERQHGPDDQHRNR
jgi:ADP-heptose:LPS heptosyltransferase